MSLLNEEGKALNRKLLLRHEGLELKPYHCTAGKITIGVGRNLADVGVSEAEAMMLLDNDIKEAEGQLLQHLPWVAKLEQHQKIALVNMAFNLGVRGLLKFKKMLAALQDDDINRVEAEMRDSRWARQVGRRAEEVISLMRGELDV
ncbi:glycoside hydrolase family protein [Enterovibrio coralii]|uniref:Lysozyme n=1 Tax=Enterovibrio coralii TaxID=294935 RepID=A0A135IA45_9GAMM|nr:glycoside hydrolase family protein [Enterovibrio coralii]KXF82319.1 hypothetical protein ATN88_09140 [Enterovibrio coralii]